MVVITSVHTTKFGEFYDKDIVDLSVEAINGLDYELTENTAVYVGNMMAARLYNTTQIGHVIDSRLKLGVPYYNFSVSCASGSVALYNAYRDLADGRVDQAIVLGVEKMSDFSACDLTDALMGASHFYDEYLFGFTFTALYGLIAARYLHEHDLPANLLDGISKKSHKNALSNQNAQFQRELNDSDFDKSMVVSDPLKLLHCSPFTDGAAALVLRNDGDGIQIKDIELCQSSIALKDRESLVSLDSAKDAAKNLYERQSIGPKDIDIFEVHDCFAIAEAIAHEDLGLSDPGKGLADAAENKYRVNVSGGLKACGHPVGATGVKQVAYLVDHLKNSDNKLALAHNVAGTGNTTVLTLLSK